MKQIEDNTLVIRSFNHLMNYGIVSQLDDSVKIEWDFIQPPFKGIEDEIRYETD